ncbi:hypothetical protein B0H14DRAFT_2615002 [Mycena olivaceomarginata]|nr:hypothetical protein B0H14DRAFT_2615002 [Mycena olivaceomarginata]
MGQKSKFSAEQNKHIESFFPDFLKKLDNGVPSGELTLWKQNTASNILDSPLFESLDLQTMTRKEYYEGNSVWDGLSAEEQAAWNKRAEANTGDVEKNQAEFADVLSLSLQHLCQSNLLGDAEMVLFYAFGNPIMVFPCIDVNLVAIADIRLLLVHYFDECWGEGFDIPGFRQTEKVIPWADIVSHPEKYYKVESLPSSVALDHPQNLSFVQVLSLAQDLRDKSGLESPNPFCFLAPEKILVPDSLPPPPRPLPKSRVIVSPPLTLPPNVPVDGSPLPPPSTPPPEVHVVGSPLPPPSTPPPEVHVVGSPCRPPSTPPPEVHVVGSPLPPPSTPPPEVHVVGSPLPPPSTPPPQNLVVGLPPPLSSPCPKDTLSSSKKERDIQDGWSLTRMGRKFDRTETVDESVLNSGLISLDHQVDNHLINPTRRGSDGCGPGLGVYFRLREDNQMLQWWRDALVAGNWMIEVELLKNHRFILSMRPPGACRHFCMTESSFQNLFTMLLLDIGVNGAGRAAFGGRTLMKWWWKRRQR